MSKITSTSINEIQNQAGLSSAYWKLFGENFKTVSTGNAKENIKFVTEYSNAYAEALKNNNPEKYNSVMLSADGQDLSSELPKTIMQNNIPNTVQNAGQYRLIATQIKNIINAADVQIESERNEIYGDNANAPVENNTEAMGVQSVTEPKNITLTRMGDFYEAFGDEALELAEKLKLTPTYKTVNGVKTAVVGFTVHALEKYKGALGNTYNLIISDNATDTIADNTTVTAQNQAVSDGTDIIDHTKGVDGLKLIDTDSSVETMDEIKYTHLYDEEKVSKEYLNSVNTEIENAVISIRNGDIDSVPDVINVTEMNADTIKAISEIVGFDVSGYTCKIERDRLAHIEKRHGINGEHDHSLSDPKDTARMGYVINNSDSIKYRLEHNGGICHAEHATLCNSPTVAEHKQ